MMMITYLLHMVAEHHSLVSILRSHIRIHTSKKRRLITTLCFPMQLIQLIRPAAESKTLLYAPSLQLVPVTFTDLQRQ
jgi:hypothetical protein